MFHDFSLCLWCMDAFLQLQKGQAGCLVLYKQVADLRRRSLEGDSPEQAAQRGEGISGHIQTHQGTFLCSLL